MLDSRSKIGEIKPSFFMSLIELIIASIFLGFVFAIICGITSFWIPSLSLFYPKVWVACFTAAPIFLAIYIVVMVVFILPIMEKRKSRNKEELK